MHEYAKNIIDIYRRYAEVWGSRRGSALYEGKWLSKFSELLPQAPSVLDIGCGTGLPIARNLVGNGCNVTGVDASPEMLGIARVNLPTSELIVADMRTLNLGKQFNGLLAWDSMFHLTPDDQRSMFSVFERHAAPGAALMFTGGTGHGTAMGEFEGEPLYHASLDAEEYLNLMRDHGFTQLEQVFEDPDCGRRSIWLAQFRS